MQVWKYDLQPGPQIIQMPRGAELLYVNTQTVEKRGPNGFGRWDEPRLWALVDPSVPVVGRGISVHGTGHDIIELGRYVGTFFLTALVFHVFDHGENPTDG